MGQVERKCGAELQRDLHRPGRAEVRKRNFRSSQARSSRSGTSGLHRPSKAEEVHWNFRSSWARLSGSAEAELQRSSQAR